MKNNRTLWFVFGGFFHIFSWAALFVYAGVKYRGTISEHPFVLVYAFALILVVGMIMSSLKETSEHGYGIFRKIARAARRVVPLLILLVLVLILNRNIGGFVDVIVFATVGNIIAQPFGVLSYYASPQYTEDTGTNRILEKL